MEEEKAKLGDEESVGFSSTVERVCMESQDVRDEAIQVELIVKFLQAVFSCLDLPLKIMVSGSTREHTRISKTSDIDIVIIPTHVVVNEDCLEYDTNKPCHVRIRADLAPDILKEFRHGTTDYISVKPLKNFERTDIFPALVSWDYMRNLLDTPFNIRADTFDLMTKTKVGRLLQTLTLDSSFREIFGYENTRKTVSENFLDEWVRTVGKAFPSEDNGMFRSNFEQIISDPGKLKELLIRDSEESHSKRQNLNIVFKISEIALSPFRTLRQNYQTDDCKRFDSEPERILSYLVHFIKHLKGTESRNSNTDTRLCEEKCPDNTDELCLLDDVLSSENEADAVSTMNANSRSGNEDSAESICTPKCVRSMDILPLLKCSGKLRFLEEYKKRSNRLWPSHTVTDAIVESGFGLVCKYPSESQCPDIDFQLAFNEAEFILAQNMSPSQKGCLRLLKFLKNKVTSIIFDPCENLMTSYHVRTAFYWFSETKNEHFWLHTPVIECARRVMNFMFQHMRERNMPHYFVPRMNVFADISKPNMNILLTLWSQLYSDPLRDINFVSMLSPTLIGTPETDEIQTKFLGENVVLPKNVAISKSPVGGHHDALHSDGEILSYFKDFVDDPIAIRDISKDGVGDDRASDKSGVMNDVLTEMTAFLRTKHQRTQCNDSDKEIRNLSLYKGGIQEIASIVSDSFAKSKGSVCNDKECLDEPFNIGESTGNSPRNATLTKVLGDLSSGFMNRTQDKSLDALNYESSSGVTKTSRTSQRTSSIYSPDHVVCHEKNDIDPDEESSTKTEHLNYRKEQNMNFRRDGTGIKSVLSEVTRHGLTLVQDIDKADFDDNMKSFISESMTNLMSACETDNLFSRCSSKFEAMKEKTESSTKSEAMEEDFELD